MSKMYSIIEGLCTAKGITVGKMCGALHVSRGMLSDLNNDRTEELSPKTARKIADYFGVSVDYLYGYEQNAQKETPTLTKKDERDIARDLEAIMNEMAQGGDMMFDGNPMSEEAKESIMAAMKLGLQAAKVKNKERFAPKKYRR